jgi:hypothetical protein
MAHQSKKQQYSSMEDERKRKGIKKGGNWKEGGGPAHQPATCPFISPSTLSQSLQNGQHLQLIHVARRSLIAPSA